MSIKQDNERLEQAAWEPEDHEGPGCASAAIWGVLITLAVASVVAFLRVKGVL